MTNRGRGQVPHLLGQAQADSPGGQRPPATPLSLSCVVVLKGNPCLCLVMSEHLMRLKTTENTQETINRENR